MNNKKYMFSYIFLIICLASFCIYLHLNKALNVTQKYFIDIITKYGEKIKQLYF